MKNFILFAFWIVCLSAQGEVIHLRESDLSQLVADNNHLIKASKREVLSLEEKTGSFRMSLIPRLSLYGSQERFRVGSSSEFNQPTYGLEVSVNLYNGGKDLTQGQIEDLNLKKGNAKHYTNSIDQLEDARKTFWQALFYREIIKKHDEALRLITINQKAAQRRINAGIATQTDLFEFQIKNQEIVQDKEVATLAMKKYLGHLKVIIGLDQSKEIEIIDEFVHQHDWRTLVSHSESDHDFLLEEQRLEIERSQKAVGLQKGKWFPKLDAFALWLQENQREELGRPLASDRQESAIGLRATWQMAEFFNSEANARASKQTTLAHKERLLYQEKEIEYEIHMELKEIELLDKMMHVADGNVKKSKQYFEMMKTEYKRGVKSSNDMLSATEKLIQTEIQKMQLVRDFHLAKVHILKKFGR